MQETSLQSYEEVPYPAKPLFPTHPDCLATVGLLMGMNPAPVDRCRVLELGCATGGNLLPMAAALPNSTFVGIDLSPSQVAVGQEMANRLGLTNLTLLPLSILDVGDDFGTFDYIACHGVYSWVPPVVQDKILAICQRHLAPQGIAYISYNCYPGWHGRALVRDLMRFHAGQFDDPPTRIQQARAFLQFLATNTTQADGYYPKLLQDEVNILEKAPDQYLFHEHLEDANQPLYFQDFVGRASAKGLQYLGESWFHTSLDSLPAEVAQTLVELSSDLIRLEQYLDFLKNRTFRRTLLCRDDIKLDRTPGPEILDRLHLTALVRPESPQPILGPESVETFRADEGGSVATTNPLLKAALMTLFESWPQAVSFTDLWESVKQRIDILPQGRTIVAASLLKLYLTNLTAFHLHPPRFTLRPGPKPLACPLARLQSETTGHVTNRRHRLVFLDDAHRALLRRLDGTCDRAALGDTPDLEGALNRLARSSLLLE